MPIQYSSPLMTCSIFPHVLRKNPLVHLTNKQSKSFDFMVAANHQILKGDSSIFFLQFSNLKYFYHKSLFDLNNTNSREKIQPRYIYFHERVSIKFPTKSLKIYHGHLFIPKKFLFQSRPNLNWQRLQANGVDLRVSYKVASMELPLLI